MRALPFFEWENLVLKSGGIRKHALTCLRLAAECRSIAAAIPIPALKVKFLELANIWEEIADKPLIDQTKPTLH